MQIYISKKSKFVNAFTQKITLYEAKINMVGTIKKS